MLPILLSIFVFVSIECSEKNNKNTSVQVDTNNLDIRLILHETNKIDKDCQCTCCKEEFKLIKEHIWRTIDIYNNNINNMIFNSNRIISDARDANCYINKRIDFLYKLIENENKGLHKEIYELQKNYAELYAKFAHVEKYIEDSKKEKEQKK